MNTKSEEEKYVPNISNLTTCKCEACYFKKYNFGSSSDFVWKFDLSNRQWIYFQIFPSQTSSFYGYYILWLGIHIANNFTVCDK